MSNPNKRARLPAGPSDVPVQRLRLVGEGNVPAAVAARDQAGPAQPALLLAVLALPAPDASVASAREAGLLPEAERTGGNLPVVVGTSVRATTAERHRHLSG
jgi:hypothetical protein